MVAIRGCDRCVEPIATLRLEFETDNADFGTFSEMQIGRFTERELDEMSNVLSSSEAMKPIGPTRITAHGWPVLSTAPI
jgi:hypothetical protein